MAPAPGKGFFASNTEMEMICEEQPLSAEQIEHYSKRISLLKNANLDMMLSDVSGNTGSIIHHTGTNTTTSSTNQNGQALIIMGSSTTTSNAVTASTSTGLKVPPWRHSMPAAVPTGIRKAVIVPSTQPRPDGHRFVRYHPINTNANTATRMHVPPPRMTSPPVRMQPVTQARYSPPTPQRLKSPSQLQRVLTAPCASTSPARSMPEFVDLTAENPEQSKKVKEKMFPSLEVIPRVYLNKNTNTAEENLRRNALDANVKKIIYSDNSEFIEYLSDKNLLSSSYTCKKHAVTLSLGRAQGLDPTAEDGGFGWLDICCPDVKITTHSIFENAQCNIKSTLKLIYHWACQTTINHILDWVKVSAICVKTVYCHLRAACTVAINENFPKLGAHGTNVEVGMINIGTTAGVRGPNNQNQPYLKFFIMGAFDPEKKLIRLRAFERKSLKSQHERMSKMLETLKTWVHPNCAILTSMNDKDSNWARLGFRNVKQAELPQLTDYLSNWLPRLFQNTINMISTALVQQILDELVWREMWGSTASKAFEKIIEQLADLTKSCQEYGVSLCNKLSKVANNPFDNCAVSSWKLPTQTQKQVLNTTQTPMSLPLLAEITQFSVGPTLTSPFEQQGTSKITLDSYYYGNFTRDMPYRKPPSLSCDCVLCGKEFKDNTVFSEHLISHALNKTMENNLLISYCKICFKVSHNMDFHNHKSHNMTNVICKICNLQKKTAEELITHMTSYHTELELPYTCDICFFRTSSYVQLKSHFTKLHRHDSVLLCPFCYKVVYLTKPNKEEIMQNQFYFLRHIQRHQLPMARKCERCALKFINNSLLRIHSMKDHISCRHLSGVKRMENSQAFKLETPTSDPIFPKIDSEGSSFEPAAKVNPDSLKFISFCKDCEAPFTEDHFGKDMFCNQFDCKFKTTCSYALSAHQMMTHGSKWDGIQFHKFEDCFNESPKLNLICVNCRYTTNNPNTMSYHLASSCIGSYCLNNSSSNSTTHKRKRSGDSKKRRDRRR